MPSSSSYETGDFLMHRAFVLETYRTSYPASDVDSASTLDGMEPVLDRLVRIGR